MDIVGCIISNAIQLEHAIHGQKVDQLIQIKFQKNGHAKQEYKMPEYEKITAHEFVQWLKGYLEAIDATNITYKEYEKIQEKLHSVKPKDDE